MFKRQWLMAMVLCLVLPMLAACGGEEPTATAPAPTASTGGSDATSETASEQPAAAGELNWAALKVEDGATISLVASGNPEEQKIYQESIERFKQQFPNVNVTFEAVAADYPLKIKADAAGGTLGDVFFMDSGLMNALAPNGILLALDPSMQQVGMQASDFAGPLINLFQLDGKTYGLPKDFGGLAVHINNEMAKAAGVSIPEDGNWSWDDFRAAAEKMTQGEGNNKVFGICTPPDIDRMGAFVFANGGQIISDDNTQALYNQPAAVEAINFWYQLYKDGYGAVPKEIGQDWCGAAFGNKKTAMVVEGGWLFNFMTQSFPDVDYTTVAMPKAPTGERATLLFTNAWGVAADTQFPNAAAALAMFLVSPTNQQPIAETGFALPSWKSLLDLPFFESHPKENVIAKSADYGHLAVYSAKNDDFRKPLSDALERVWLGRQDLQPALDEAAKASTEVLQQ